MRMLDYTVTVPPIAPVVTPQEFIDHARINGVTVGLQPDLIEREINAATNRAELYTRRSLITQTIAATFTPDITSSECSAYSAGNACFLPRGKVQSVEGVKVAGDDLAPDGWTWDGGNVVTLAAPATGAAVITFISGYGDDATAVPDLIREGILRYATELYESRSGAPSPIVAQSRRLTGSTATLPLGIVDNWRPYQLEISG
jgi:hypothetical protein